MCLSCIQVSDICGECIAQPHIDCRAAVLLIKDISGTVGNLDDSADKGHGSVLFHRADRKAVLYIVRIRKIGGIGADIGITARKHQLCFVRHLQVDKLSGRNIHRSFSADIRSDTFRNVVIADRISVAAGKRHADRKAIHDRMIHDRILNRNNTRIPGFFCPDRIQCDRCSNRCIEIICFCGDILSFGMRCFRKRFIGGPSKEGDSFRSRIDRRRSRFRNRLAFVYRLLINPAVSVTVPVAVHLCCPGAAVGVKAYKRLLGKGNGGIGNAVAQPSFYFERVRIIDAQNCRVCEFMEGRLILDRVVIACFRSASAYGI